MMQWNTLCRLPRWLPTLCFNANIHERGLGCNGYGEWLSRDVPPFSDPVVLGWGEGWPSERQRENAKTNKASVQITNGYLLSCCCVFTRDEPGVLQIKIETRRRETDDAKTQPCMWRLTCERGCGKDWMVGRAIGPWWRLHIRVNLRAEMWISFIVHTRRRLCPVYLKPTGS